VALEVLVQSQPDFAAQLHLQAGLVGQRVVLRQADIYPQVGEEAVRPLVLVELEEQYQCPLLKFEMVLAAAVSLAAMEEL